MTRKIPMRKCVVTHSKYPKDELIRIVLTPEKNIEIDLTGRKNGRGAYLLHTEEVVLKAKESGSLARSLKFEIPESIYQELIELIDEK